MYENQYQLQQQMQQQLFANFEAAKQYYGTIECWSARALMPILGYTRWENFNMTIDRAKTSCQNNNHLISDHFREVTKVIQQGASGCIERDIGDILLTRYAAYLIAMNGDSRKPEIAYAQSYFAVQTRRMEHVEQRILDNERVAGRVRLSATETTLSETMYEHGVSAGRFGTIRSKGDQALFGGHTTAEMKNKLGIPANQPIADYLAPVLVDAKFLAASMTTHHITTKNLQGENVITKTHVDNNLGIRKMLKEHDIEPETTPIREDFKKVDRRLKTDERNIPKLNNFNIGNDE